MKVYVVLYGERGFDSTIKGVFLVERVAQRCRDKIRETITSSVDFAEIEEHEVHI